MIKCGSQTYNDSSETYDEPDEEGHGGAIIN